MTNAMSTGAFVRKTLSIAFDPAVVFFCALIAFPLTFGLSLSGSLQWLVIAVFLIVYSTSAIMKFATQVTRALALGQTVPSAQNAVFDYFRMSWAFAPWLSLSMLAALGAVVGLKLGDTALIVYAALVLPLVPAIIAVVSVNCQPLSMLRLPELLKVIAIMGVDYLKLLACWALIALVELVQPFLPVSMPLLVHAFVFLLQMMLLFVAAGVLLFQHRVALDIPVEREEKHIRQQWQRDAAVLSERRSVLGRAYVFFSRGNAPSGLECLRDYLREHDDDDSWQWFLDEMRGWEQRNPHLMLARNYFSHLVANDDRAGAAQLLLTCMSIDKDFAPHPHDRGYARRLLDGHAFAPLAEHWR
ncbi:MAG: hypothetical protein AAFO81_05700 [Pseudomonadota bacterium]